MGFIKNTLDDIKNSVENTMSFASISIQGSGVSYAEWNVIMDRLSRQGMTGDYTIFYEKTKDRNYISIYDNIHSTEWRYDYVAQSLMPVDRIVKRRNRS